MKNLSLLLVVFLLVGSWPAVAQESKQPRAAAEKKAAVGNEPIDFEKARGLLRKKQGGEKLTEDEAAYLARAQAARAAGKAVEAGKKTAKADDRNQPPQGGKDSIGQKPLTEMSADDR